MHKCRNRSLKHLIEIYVFIGIVEPFLSSNDMRDFHLPVINDVGEMEGRPAISSDYDEILQWLEIHFAVYLISKVLGKREEVSFDAYCVWMALLQSFTDLLL